MVVYDIQCSKGHVFESWFKDSKTFNVQSKKNLLTCPVCNDSQVQRAPMAPRISSGKSKNKASKEYTEQALKAITNTQEFIEKNCDNVGKGFAEEARKIHYGDVTKRNIWGEATQEEAEELKKEGIEFGEIPFPISSRDS